LINEKRCGRMEKMRHWLERLIIYFYPFLLSFYYLSILSSLSLLSILLSIYPPLYLSSSLSIHLPLYLSSLYTLVLSIYIRSIILIYSFYSFFHILTFNSNSFNIIILFPYSFTFYSPSDILLILISVNFIIFQLILLIFHIYPNNMSNLNDVNNIMKY
jgi:hypothetical protein